MHEAGVGGDAVEETRLSKFSNLGNFGSVCEKLHRLESARPVVDGVAIAAGRRSVIRFEGSRA
jgi:hypothetical protein